MKQLLNGFTAPIEQVDMEAFKKALFGFIADLGSAGGKIVCATPGGTEGLELILSRPFCYHNAEK